MQPMIVQPPDTTGAALSELKAWLGITRPHDDVLLLNLLQTSLSACDEAIGQTPLLKTVEEKITAVPGWHCLQSSPVRALVQVEAVSTDESRSIVANQTANLDIDVSGSARFEVTESMEEASLAIQFTCGIASDWTYIPPALKQGVIRLAAFYFRERDQVGAKQMPLPESINSLWQPWRQLRLS